MLRGIEAEMSLNVVPLITLTSRDIMTSFLNIILFTPLGFGIPLITHLRMKKVFTIGAIFSIIVELLQLLTGYLAKTTFRIADINDVIFNTVGVVIGYGLFIGFVRLFRLITYKRKVSANPILRYLCERPQVDK